MKNCASLRTMLCMALLATLTACGGGGGGGNDKDPTASPSQKTNQQLTIEGGDSTVAPGTYAVDTSYRDASWTVVADVDVLEAVGPSSTQFNSRFIYAQGNPKKFAILFTDQTNGLGEQFACRSEQWSAAEINMLNDIKEGSTISLCPASIAIDTNERRISFSGLKLPSLSNPVKAVFLGGNFAWTLQSTTPRLVGSRSITIEPGSSATPGTYQILLGDGGSDILADMIFDTTAVSSGTVSLNYYSLQADPSRYLVIAQASTAPPGGLYACASNAWTDEEMIKLGNEENGLGRGLVRCPSQVIVLSNRLILDKASLNRVGAPGASGNVIVLSANIPVSASSAGAVEISPSPAPAPTVVSPQ